MGKLHSMLGHQNRAGEHHWHAPRHIPDDYIDPAPEAEKAYKRVR
jgi:hypothetical protein